MRTAAAAGHADIQAYSAEFTVVGSTSATDARVNTRTTYTPDEKGVPIYWLDGTKVADEYEDFYDGDWDDETNSKDESGNARSLISTVDRPFTGSDHDGTESFSLSVSRALGTDTVRVGRPDNSAVGRGPLGSGSHRPHADSHPFYAISPVFVIDVSPAVTITPTSLTVTEGSTADYTVELNVVPTADVTINIAGGGDVTVNPSSLTFSSTTWNMAQTVTVTAARDSDSDDDTQTVTHTVATNSAAEYLGATLDGLAVTVTDDDVTVTFDLATYSVNEGSTVTVKVQLNADPMRNLTIPITTTNQDGATTDDYSGVPASLAFASGDTEKSFTFTATEDTVDDHGESVKLSFGTLPAGVTAGTTNEATITITGPVTAPQGWALTPTGLGQGDKFRLLFITHTGHSSANTDIENYNAYVQSQANAGNAHADIKAYSSWFRVLGSTEDVDARDNTMTTGTGVPIYWMNGDKVADNYADFYDGSWDSETAADRTGTTSSATVRIWTGSDSNGVEAIPGAASRALGTNSVRLGRLNGAGDPISTGGTANAGTNYRYYALSGIFLVGEPTSTNNAATGAPSISGVLQQTEVLTADTASIADADGVGAFSYQWIADGTDISGATSETHTITSTEVGKAISVRVSFTDGQGYSESVSSAATYAVVASGATTRLYWLATMTVGAVPGDGLYGYSDFAHSHLGAITAPQFTVADVQHSAIRVVYDLSGADNDLSLYLSPPFTGPFTLHTGDIATAFASSDANQATIDDYRIYTWVNSFPGWAAGQQVAVFLQGSLNNLATGAPTITGDARVNGVLTANTSGITDDDGTASATFTYQWISFDGTDDTDITGATSSTYTVQPEDAGKQIKVQVNFTDDLSYAEGPFYSLLTDTVNTPATGAPTITGSPRVGERLTADTSEISDADGTASANFTYQWVRFDRTVTTDISGATASTYTLTADDVDQRIKVKVSFTDDAGAPAGAEGPLASLPTDPVAGSDVLVRNTGKPVFTGASATLSSSSSKFAQRFTTGSTLAGYALNSISVLFTTIGDTTTVGTELTVTLNADDSGSPGDPLCTLSDPATFFASGIHTFSTPTTGTDLCPTLDPSTTYYVVLSRANGNTHVIVVSATNILAQDSGSAQGWTIDDRSHVYTNASSTWAQATIPSNLLIDVRGDTGNEVTVPANWSLKPTGLTTGNKFRLMFITGTGHAPSSTDITTYNTYVQGQAAVGHADIQDYSSAFHVLGSTVDVDARDNTDTTGTGVPTYWLNGTKVADDYPDLYDRTWDDEANTTNRDGTTITTPGHVWTGSADDGTEEFDGGASRAFGSSRVRTGRPDSSAHGPLSSSSSYLQSQTLHPYYALSMVFVIPNNLPTGLPKITGTPRVDQTLTADTSAIEDKDGLSNVNYAYQWIRNDGTNDADINGATSLTYTLKSEDADNQIKVNVTFTDDAGDTEGPLTSLPTEYVAAADVLVKNTEHTTTNAADIADGSTKYGQRFTSGPSLTGYTITSIGVHFTEIGNTATVGAELTATLNADSSGAPGDALCTLADPNNFSASGLHAFTASTTGTDLCPELEPSTIYFVVLERANLNTGTIEWSATSTLGQHPGSANGWSIDDRGHIYNNALSTWGAFQAPSNLIIQVKGDLDTETTVPADWSLIPTGLTSGDSFRLLFLTATGHSPTSTNIADYNTYVQGRAAGGHADIQEYSYWFRVLGSAAYSTAVENTRTSYTSSEKGFPIYWLNGIKVVDDYEDLYDGAWDDEANPRDRDGATVSADHVWTGSTHSGGLGLYFGLNNVEVGRLHPTLGGPLSSTTAFTPDTNWPYYALSNVFEVGPPDPGVTLTPPTLTVNEGSTADYKVKLTVAPTADVTITITGGGDVSVAPASLTFSTTTWSTDQTVTVTAAQDSDTADDMQNVTHAVDTGSADEYLGATLDSLVVEQSWTDG